MKIKENIIYATLFTFIFSFIFVFILSLTNYYTRPIIKKNNDLFQRKAVLNAMKIKYQSDEEAYKIYNRLIEEKNIEDYIIYYSKSAEKNIGIQFTGQGLWGTIKGILTFKSDLSKINGIDFISHNETPGLGGRIEEDWFTKQFDNEKIISNKINFSTASSGKGDYNNENGIIDSISGATRTSQLLEQIINNYIKIMKTLQEEGKL